ncbi:hypothetical protein [Lysobacter sp. ESA13C]|uniref:DUF7940 domain-containing protein n=1 Tax=Lysobacter sp. ESA13C TaxID=2862676 RepID=UPI001CC07324|nr:hypothetical protein [Lysobacter sp. ESA13C]
MKLIENWREGWRFWSTWAFALLVAAPEAYPALQALGLLEPGALPAPFAWAVRGIAAAGFVARFICQNKPKDKS